MNLQTGAFGDPMDMQTLILFWTKMEMLHYPGAAETKSYLEERLKQQQMQQQMAMQAQMQLQQQVEQQARQDAMRQARANAAQAQMQQLP